MVAATDRASEQEVFANLKEMQEHYTECTGNADAWQAVKTGLRVSLQGNASLAGHLADVCNSMLLGGSVCVGFSYNTEN